MSFFRNVSHSCARITASIALLAASALAAQAQVVFSPPKNISNSSGNTQSQQVAADGKGNINLVWADNSPGNYAIFVSHSSDRGTTFSVPRSISKHAQSTASGPQIIAGSSGNFSVAWTETSPDGTSNFISFSHSADGGVTFSNPQNISGDAGAATGPRMAVDGSGNVSVVWVDTSLGNEEIFSSHSADGGTTFTTPVNVSNDAGKSFEPQVAVDSRGNIDVAWADNTPSGSAGFLDVFFSRSTDGGATFSAPLQVTQSDQYVNVSGFSQISAGANGSIYLLWIHHTPFSAYALFSRSTDGGATFSSPLGAAAIAGFSFATSAMMALDPSGNDIGVVAPFFDTDESGGSGPFFGFGASTDAGASFPVGSLNLENGTSNPAVQIATDVIGRFDIVDSFSGSQYPFHTNPCLCFSQSADGNEFSSTIISSYSPNSLSIALDASGNASIAWLQTATSGGPANVFFSRGTVPPFSFSISPVRVSEGGSSTGTVKLISPAPAGGATISLSSSNPSVASVPASVTVPEGAGSATFTVSGDATQSFTFTSITASLNGSTNTASLSVDPLFQVFINGSTTGGNTASGEIALSLVAPTGGLVISLSSSDPSTASVPASVTVSVGQRFAFFNIPMSSVAAPTTIQITGTGNGFSHSTSFTVQPARLQQLSVSPTTATGGASSTGTVTLTGPAIAGGAVVSLSSSDPSATVPASVTVPAGSTSASFTITTNPGSSSTNVTIAASYNGVTLTAPLTVKPLIVTGLTVQPTIGGGGSAYMNACMNVQVPFDTLVTISSSNPSVASVPASVTIPQGSACKFFNNIISTSPVSADTNVTISATSGGVTLTGTLTVQPTMLQNIDAFAVTGGNATTGQIILNGPAPAGGITVSVTSSDPSVASVPATVTVPAGIQVENFSISTTPVSTTTAITVTASYNGVTRSYQFPVFPPQ